MKTKKFIKRIPTNIFIFLLVSNMFSFCFFMNSVSAESIDWSGNSGLRPDVAGIGIGTELGILAAVGFLLFPGLNMWMLWSILIGSGGGALLTMRQTVTQTVTFQCGPWEHPTNINNCTLCNNLGDLCTEYKCKSLGQSCAYDAGSGVCFENNTGDMEAPIIFPRIDSLSEGYTNRSFVGESQGGIGGYQIVQKNGKNYINASDPITFGITTNEPARCKISMSPTSDYESTNSYYIGGISKIRYNFTEYMNLPNADFFRGANLTLKNGKEMNFYIWCRDGRGNTNEQPYQIRFNVDPDPDLTPPKIVGSSIKDDACVGNQSVDLFLYVNDASYINECRWDREDKSFEAMNPDNAMNCVMSTQNASYKSECFGSIDSVSRAGTMYYFTCKDYNNNTNSESAYSLNLRTGSELRISSIIPDNTTIYASLQSVPVTLEVQTLLGCNDGKAICSYTDKKITERYRNALTFRDTNNDDGVSTTTLYLGDGDYEYLIECEDEGGHKENQTIEFSVEIDTESPIVARLLEEDGKLKIITTYDSECVYTNTDCVYDFSKGISIPYNMTDEHVLAWDKTKTYYIKCRDGYREAPAECSTIVRSTSI